MVATRVLGAAMVAALLAGNGTSASKQEPPVRPPSTTTGLTPGTVALMANAMDSADAHERLRRALAREDATIRAVAARVAGTPGTHRPRR